jgi:CBS domain-containing protein
LKKVEGWNLEKFPTIIADIMSKPAMSLTKDTNLRDAAFLMGERNIGSIIVTEMGKPVGIVTKRDIIQRAVTLCLDPCETKISQIMTYPLKTISPNVNILDGIRKLKEEEVTQLVVMDDGKLVGIVSERDLCRAVSIAALTSFSTLLRK